MPSKVNQDIDTVLENEVEDFFIGHPADIPPCYGKYSEPLRHIVWMSGVGITEDFKVVSVIRCEKRLNEMSDRMRMKVRGYITDPQFFLRAFVSSS